MLNLPSFGSVAEALEVVPGVDRTWALPLCVSLSFWELFLLVFWAVMPGSATEAGGKPELLLAVCLDFIVLGCRSCCNFQMLE